MITVFLSETTTQTTKLKVGEALFLSVLVWAAGMVFAVVLVADVIMCPLGIT